MAEPAPSTASASRRRRVLVGAVVAAVVVAGGGLAASTAIRSPADEAADAEPPEPTLLTAEVTSTVVREVVVLRGTVTAASEYEVTPVAAEAATQVVTDEGLPDGSAIAAGDVLVEVSGRPLIALAGSRPAYRDLVPGSEGSDVAQLQASLIDLGFGVGDDELGQYGPGTGAAVADLYEAKGYGPSVAGDPGAVEAARGAVAEADERVDVVVATPGATQADVDAAAAALDEARDQLARLQRTTGPKVPLAEHVFLPAFPGVVVSSSARLGAGVEAPLLVVAAGELVVVGRLNRADAGLVRAGMSVALSGAGVDAEATVSEVGGSAPAAPGDEPPDDDTGGDTSTDPAGRSVTIAPTDPLPPSAVGADVQVTVTSAASDGDVLAVPVAAVSIRADRKTYVTVLANDRRRSVEVTTGLSGEGLVEVSPVDGELRAGDRVVTSG